MSIKSIGTVRFTDFSAWIDRISRMTRDEAERIIEDMKERFARTVRPSVHKCYIENVLGELPEEERACCQALQRKLHPRCGNNFYSEKDQEDSFQASRANHIQQLQRVMEYALVFEQPVRVGYWSSREAYLFLGNPETGFTVLDPEKYMEFIPPKDWSALTPAEAWKTIAAPAGLAEEPPRQSLLPANVQNTVSVRSLSESRAGFVGQIESLNQKLEDIRQESTAELAKLREEIRKKEQELAAKKEALMAELDAKLAEATRQKDSLEMQIFLLDSQIYDICCYAGETVRFMQIAKGRPAPASEPVVVYQKLRFLDEDLGRLASIYELQWNNISMFEDVLRHHPEAQDIFAPNERCVMLVRLSRTGRLQSVENTPYYQTLVNYKYYHGGTVGIILRNGENVYLGWTDDERVHIADDLIPGRAIITTEIPGDNPDRTLSRREKEKRYQEKRKAAFEIIDGVVSRHFVYSVLQGILDNSDLLGLPKGTDIGTPGPLVVHSMAENALEDNRFGSFADLVDRCNRHATRGDNILTMTWVVAHSDRYTTNDRGIGHADRTHDVRCPDCEILPVNLVKDLTRTKMYSISYAQQYAGRDPIADQRVSLTISADDYDGMSEEERKDFAARYPDHRIEESFFHIKKEVYVSLPKGYYWLGHNDSTARANFRLFSDEYVNLTYMNSVWLKYAINSKKLGGWSLNHDILDYAHAIRYLKKALEHVRAREAKEKTLLDAILPEICMDPNWPVALSEWKLANDEHPVRNLTAYQAKRFARHLGYTI